MLRPPFKPLAPPLGVAPQILRTTGLVLRLAYKQHCKSIQCILNGHIR
jgi:hypothetical protein